MNRENLLFAIGGFLLGLIAGALVIGPRLSQGHSDGKVTAAGVVPPSSSADASPATSSAEVMEIVRQQISQLQQIVAADPKNFDALVELGNLYMDGAKYAQALQYYEQALALKADADVSTDFGICLRETGNHQRALEVFREVQARNPSHWQSLFNEAVVLVDMKRVDEAKAVLGKLKQLRPNDQEIIRFEQALQSTP